jgi:predicted MFS family arabinose efflux permease
VELVGEEHITNADSLNSAVFTGTRVLGGAVAGTMIEAFGLWSPFLLDAVSYVGVIVALLAMRIHELHAQRKAEREPGLARAGLRYVWSSQALRVPLVVMALVYLFTFNFSVLVPLQAHQRYEGSGMEIGWLYAALGLGAFLGAIAMANRQTEPTLRRLAGFSIAFGVFLAVAGWAPTFVLGLIPMVPVGYASMLFAITANSTLQRFTRADMRGRVMALYTTIFLGSSAVGGPIAGWVGESWGAREALIASGAVAVVAGLLALRAREAAPTITEVPTADTAARSR